MAQLDDIREGLAANLYALKTDGVVGHVSPYFQENAQSPSVHVPGLAPFEYGMGFGEEGGDEFALLIEAIIGRATDIGSQKTLNALLATSGTTSLKRAAESDGQLTSRMDDKGVITTGQAAAASYVLVARYLGQSRTVVNNAEMLVATWAVRVGA